MRILSIVNKDFYEANKDEILALVSPAIGIFKPSIVGGLVLMGTVDIRQVANADVYVTPNRITVGSGDDERLETTSEFISRISVTLNEAITKVIKSGSTYAITVNSYSEMDVVKAMSNWPSQNETLN